MRHETVDEAPHVGARGGEVPVRLQGESAAILGRNDHPEAVVFEDGDHHLADQRLVVIRAAAVKVDDRRCALVQSPMATCATLKRPAGEARHRRVTMDADDALDEAAHRPVVQHPVCQRGNRSPRRPITVGRAIIWLRSGMPRFSQRFARARELISAIFTSCGQTCVQMPQPEQ